MKRKPNPKYAALTLLGNSQAAFPKSPLQTTLEAFPNPSPQRDYSIRLDCPSSALLISAPAHRSTGASPITPTRPFPTPEW